MMDTTPEPFLLLEPDAAPRLEAVPPFMPAAEPLSRGWSPAFIGVATLGLGIPTLWGAWLVGALFDRRSALGWAGSVVLLVGLSLIGLGIGRELRGLAALRRSIGSAMSLPVERRIGFSGRRGVGWNGYRSTLRSCQLSPQLTPRNLCLRSCVRGRCKRYGTRRMYSGGPPLFKASRSLQRPLRLQWTFWPLAGAACG
jgi:hypothetical protein